GQEVATYDDFTCLYGTAGGTGTGGLALGWATPATGITQTTGDVLCGPGSGVQGCTLANSGVTAGSYPFSADNIPVIPFDAKGRATSATETAIAIANANLVAGAYPNISSVAASGVTAGTYPTLSTSVPTITGGSDGRLPSA